MSNVGTDTCDYLGSLVQDFLNQLPTGEVRIRLERTGTTKLCFKFISGDKEVRLHRDVRELGLFTHPRTRGMNDADDAVNKIQLARDRLFDGVTR